jgi:hypothetical protein
MRSPYRIVPIIVAVLVVAAAVFQATRPVARASASDIAVAKALDGHCLARSGGTENAPRYSNRPVGCGTTAANVRVVAVLVPGADGRVVGSCPKGALAAQVFQPVAGEPVECLAPATRR